MVWSEKMRKYASIHVCTGVHGVHVCTTIRTHIIHMHIEHIYYIILYALYIEHVFRSKILT